MDLPRQLDAEQRRIVEQVAALSRERFAPRAARYDAESTFPFENYEDLREAGLLGLTIPREYGGLGADPLTYALSLFEMAKGCSATALTFNMHATVLTFLVPMATEEQRRRYYGAVVDDGKLMASITSEPESSFRDKFIMKTTFRPAGDGYNVSGTKHFCSLGDAADYYFVSGVLEDARSGREGVLSALVRREAPGVRLEKTWNATGMRGTASHTIHYDTFVDRSEVIGTPGQLLDIDLSGFALGYAATYLGIGEAAFEFIVDFVKSKAFSPSIGVSSQHPLTQRTVAEMGAAIRAAKLLVVEAATIKHQGDLEATMLAVSQAKYMGAEVGAMVTQKAIRLAGGRGILKELPLERYHRDALAGPVMAPSNDRCLETAGKIICGLDAAMLEISLVDGD